MYSIDVLGFGGEFEAASLYYQMVNTTKDGGPGQLTPYGWQNFLPEEGLRAPGRDAVEMRHLAMSA